jgi:plastocyanin
MKPSAYTVLALLLLPACEAENPSEPMTPPPASLAPAASPVPPTLPPSAPSLALSCQAEPRAGETPLTVRFTAFPSGGTGSYDYLWAFGDGTTSTARRPAHTYTAPGVYEAFLTLTSGEQVRRCDRPISVTGVALPPRPTPPPGSLTPPDLVITIVGIAGSQSYSPNPAVGVVGQRVIWQNADTMTHTATAGGGVFDTGLLARATGSAPITLDAAGTFPYFCGLHPSMTGTLTVLP